MEIKKSKKAEIENFRGTWLLMGTVVVLVFMFVAFEWAQHDKQIDTSLVVKDIIFTQDMIPITIPEKPLPPPEPAQANPEVFTVTDDPSTVQDGPIAGTEVTTLPVVIPVRMEADDPAPVEPDVIDFAEIMPKYKGGAKALNAFLASNLKYPPVPRESGISGKVIVQFVVDKDGTITNAQVVRGVHPHLDKEALRVINLMPAWDAGRQGGKTVRVKFTVPVLFKLQ